jgi:hypothetical protein
MSLVGEMVSRSARPARLPLVIEAPAGLTRGELHRIDAYEIEFRCNTELSLGAMVTVRLQTPAAREAVPLIVHLHARSADPSRGTTDHYGVGPFGLYSGRYVALNTLALEKLLAELSPMPQASAHPAGRHPGEAPRAPPTKRERRPLDATTGPMPAAWVKPEFRAGRPPMLLAEFPDWDRVAVSFDLDGPRVSVRVGALSDVWPGDDVLAVLRFPGGAETRFNARVITWTPQLCTLGGVLSSREILGLLREHLGGPAEPTREALSSVPNPADPEDRRLLRPRLLAMEPPTISVDVPTGYPLGEAMVFQGLTACITIARIAGLSQGDPVQVRMTLPGDQRLRLIGEVYACWGDRMAVASRLAPGNELVALVGACGRPGVELHDASVDSVER